MNHLVRDQREVQEAHLTPRLADHLQGHPELVMRTRAVYSAPCSTPWVVVDQVAEVAVLALPPPLLDTDRTRIQINALVQDGEMDPVMNEIFQVLGGVSLVEFGWLQTELERPSLNCTFVDLRCTICLFLIITIYSSGLIKFIWQV
jgi:hypothetical protein